MSISELMPSASPSEALVEALAVVREAAETLWSAQSDDELVETVTLVQQLTSALAVVEAGTVAEADARDLPKHGLHYGSTGDWLTHAAGLRRGEGKRRLVRARALDGPLARTRQGLLDADVSPGQADVIVAAIDRLVHHSTIFEMNVESYRRRTASDKQNNRRRQSSGDNQQQGATTMTG